MSLTNMTLRDYLDLLASGAPAPGGGSASALSGAQGAALTQMVCSLTIGREKYSAFEEQNRIASEECGRLREALLQQMDADTEAYNLVSQAYRMPKGTEEEKAARRQSIQESTLTATRAPLKTMELAAEAMKQTLLLVKRSNANAASDLGVAALNLWDCVNSAYLNVRINLPGIPAEEKADIQSKAQRILDAAEAMRGSICTGIWE